MQITPCPIRTRLCADESHRLHHARKYVNKVYAKWPRPKGLGEVPFQVDNGSKECAGPILPHRHEQSLKGNY